MARLPALPTQPAPLAPRALAAVPRPTLREAEAARPRAPVLQHGRAPRQLTFDFYRA
jgi:septal ring-binding cell division protein DamX